MKGEPSPFNGFAVTHDMERDMRSKLLTEKRKVLILSDLKAVQDRRIDLYKDESERAYKELRKQRVKTFLYTIGGFTLGIGLSSIAIMAIKKAGE